MDRYNIARHGQRIDIKGKERRVEEACSEESRTGTGVWICVPHGTPLPNWNDVEHHFSAPGPHLLAWDCKEHGPEVP